MNRDPIRVAVLSKHALAVRELNEAAKLANQSHGPLTADQAEAIAAQLTRAQVAIDSATDVLAPLWEVYLERKLGEPLSAILDVATWDEHEGITATRGMFCPHCALPHVGDFAGLEGMDTCRHCGKGFFFKRLPTPQGMAWSTWKTDPRVPAKGA